LRPPAAHPQILAPTLVELLGCPPVAGMSGESLLTPGERV